MTSFRLSLITAAFAVAGCTTVAPPDNTYAFRPGNGTVQSVQEARVAVPGGTAPKTPLQEMTRPRWIDGYQLSLRMDDGTSQAITQDSSEFHAGDRVQVTQEGRVLKVPARQASATQPSAVQPSAVQPSGTLTTALRPGSGTVQSVTPTGTSQQVGLTMDDGTTQVISLRGATVRPGERVTLTADGQMTRP
jgi:outer membrane lipoprotein SlyB